MFILKSIDKLITIFLVAVSLLFLSLFIYVFYINNNIMDRIVILFIISGILFIIKLLLLNYEL